MLDTLLLELKRSAEIYEEAQKKKDPELEREIGYVTACLDHNIARLQTIKKIIERHL